MNILYLNREKRNMPTNPTIEFAESILEEAKQMGAEKVVSQGGGSTIDVGKYVAWKMGISHTAIPTTAGTGSEVTKFAVFIKDGKKFTFEDDKLIPTDYILDPLNIIDLPVDVTISSGLDALCQAIESWWSPEATDESKRYSEKATWRVMDYLYKTILHPHDIEARTQMLTAANYSGKAINITHTSICHAVSYPLTIHYGIPHGLACAYTLPYFMQSFDFKGEDWERVSTLLEMLDFTKQPVDYEMVAEEALQSDRAKNCPQIVTKEDIIKALQWQN